MVLPLMSVVTYVLRLDENKDGGLPRNSDEFNVNGVMFFGVRYHEMIQDSDHVWSLPIEKVFGYILRAAPSPAHDVLVVAF